MIPVIVTIYTHSMAAIRQNHFGGRL